MRERVAAANIAGWPDRIRHGLLQRGQNEPPRSAAIAAEFRAHARPQPSSHARLSDLPRPMAQRLRCRNSQGRSGSGAVKDGWGRIRVRNSDRQAAEGGDSFAIPFAEGRRESYPASQPCSRRQPLPVFEPGNFDGTRIVTIKIFLKRFRLNSAQTVAFRPLRNNHDFQDLESILPCVNETAAYPASSTAAINSPISVMSGS